MGWIEPSSYLRKRDAFILVKAVAAMHGFELPMRFAQVHGRTGADGRYVLGSDGNDAKAQDIIEILAGAGKRFFRQGRAPSCPTYVSTVWHRNILFEMINSS